MPQIVGIRFQRAGKVYYFDPAGLELEVNDYVVVETTLGLELGRVVIAPKQVLESEVTEELKPVLRRAEAEELERAKEFESKETEALVQARSQVTRAGLPLRLMAAKYNLDGSRLTFYFRAEGRVDFRALLRELGAAFHTKVELRQVGTRDAAKLLGGLGPCGRPLCCATHLCSFTSVSMKMAREQDLSLNPAKLSGLCDRLLCCLAYECEQYRELKGKLPKVGQEVNTPTGPATVVGGNALKETVYLRLESEAIIEMPLKDLSPAT